MSQVNKSSILLLGIILFAACCLTLLLPFRLTELPSPWLVAVTIVALVALFGAMFSLSVRNRGSKQAVAVRSVAFILCIL